jgi:hypothetical protein
LIDNAEQQQRVRLVRDEVTALEAVRAEIALAVEEYFAAQRNALEDAEAASRKAIEVDELERAVDRLWEDFAASVDHALFLMDTKDIDDQHDRIRADQRNLVARIEEVQRSAAEETESMERANLNRMMHRFNRAVRECLQKQKDAIQPIHGLRCALCFKESCPFFRVPWRGHWSTHKDLEPSRNLPHCQKPNTVASLFARAHEEEFKLVLLERKSVPRKVRTPSPRLYTQPHQGNKRVPCATPHPPPFKV